MNINDYIQTDFGHVKLTLGEHIKCHHCGMEMGNRRSMSLSAHMSAIIGFVGMHKDCKPGVPHEIFGLDYGVKNLGQQKINQNGNTYNSKKIDRRCLRRRLR